MCTTDHIFAHPRDGLGHLMSVIVTARRISFGVACPSFFTLILYVAELNLAWVFRRSMNLVDAGLYSIVHRGATL